MDQNENYKAGALYLLEEAVEVVVLPEKTTMNSPIVKLDKGTVVMCLRPAIKPWSKTFTDILSGTRLYSVENRFLTKRLSEKK